MLQNLVDNAADASGSGKEVILRASAANDHVSIEVEDTGRGIQSGDLPKIFDPFFTTRPDGTGLGLTLSRSLIEAMGGKIGADSRPGRGSEFWIELEPTEPLAVSPLGSDEDPLITSRSYDAERRLLYIEDTVANVALLEGILESKGQLAAQAFDSQRYSPLYKAP